MDKKKLKNWIYYYKWYVVIGVLLAVFVIRYLLSFLGITQPKPDVQIACLTQHLVSAEAQAAVEDAFAELAGDYNGDGKVVVRLHPYLTSAENAAQETQQSAAISEVTLIGDINDCESYFFLLEDPGAFQLDWQLLADENGDCPAPQDFSADGRTVPFEALPLNLQTLNTLSEEDRLAFSGLSFGRRCFYTEKTCKHLPELEALWDTLTK